MQSITPYNKQSTLPLPFELDAHGKALEAAPSLYQNIQRIMDRCGGIVLKNTGITSPEHFSLFCNHLKLEPMRYIGGDAPRYIVSESVYVANTLPSNVEISVHSEKAYSSYFPRVIVFYCQKVASKGGRTILVDGRKVFSSMLPSVLHELQSRELIFGQNLPNRHGRGKSWQETFETDNPKDVESYLTQIGAWFEWLPDSSLRVEEKLPPIIRHDRTKEAALIAPLTRWHSSHLNPTEREFLLSNVGEIGLYHYCLFGDRTTIADGLVHNIRRLHQENSVYFEWEQGSILMLDNTITLHGREAYEGDRQVYVSMLDPSRPLHSAISKD